MPAQDALRKNAGLSQQLRLCLEPIEQVTDPGIHRPHLLFVLCSKTLSFGRQRVEIVRKRTDRKQLGYRSTARLIRAGYLFCAGLGEREGLAHEFEELREGLSHLRKRVFH